MHFPGIQWRVQSDEGTFEPRERSWIRNIYIYIHTRSRIGLYRLFSGKGAIAEIPITLQSEKYSVHLTESVFLRVLYANIMVPSIVMVGKRVFTFSADGDK